MDKLKEYIKNKMEDNRNDISSFVKGVEDRWDDGKSENGRIKAGDLIMYVYLLRRN